MDPHYSLLDLFMLWIFLPLVVASMYSEQKKAVCLDEAVAVQCQAGTSIIVTEAKYGHTEISRCVEVDTGFLGCHADVIDVLAAKCNGKQTCDVQEDDDAFRKSDHTCRKGLLLYLQFTYICVPAKPSKPCFSNALTSDTAYIFSEQTTQEGCQSVGHMGGTQFTFTAKEGQTIDVSTKWLDDHSETNTEQFGYVVDDKEENMVKPINFPNRDVTNGAKHTMTSKSNEVTVTIFHGIHPSFIVFVKAHGCEDLTLPKEFNDAMWIERDGDTTAIGCLGAKLTWNLKCVGTDWKGVVGNCSAAAPPLKLEAVLYRETSNLSLPKDVIIMMIVGVTLVAAIVIVTVSYVCYKKSIPATDVESKLDQDYVGLQPIYKAPPNPKGPPPLPQKTGATILRKPSKGSVYMNGANGANGFVPQTILKGHGQQSPPQPPPMRQNNQLQETVPLKVPDNPRVLRNSEVIVEDYENYEAPTTTERTG